MTIQLPEELQHYIENLVQSGVFGSEEEAITAAVRLLQQVGHKAASTLRPLTEEELNRQMLQSGFLGSVPPPRTNAPWNYQPIAIEGEPLSETIIRERR